MRMFAFALCLAVTACVTSPGGGAECVALQPGPGPFETALEVGYESAVNRLFFKTEPFTRDVQMVRLSPGEPNEEAVYIVDKEEFNTSHRHDYEVVTVHALSSILGAVTNDGATAIVPVDTRRMPIDTALVKELQKTWQEIIRRARFANKLDVKPIGTDYHFTAQLDVGPGSAYVQGPPKGSCPGAFAELGASLVSYARAEVKERAAIRERLLRQTRELRIRVMRPAHGTKSQASTE